MLKVTKLANMLSKSKKLFQGCVNSQRLCEFTKVVWKLTGWIQHAI